MKNNEFEHLLAVYGTLKTKHGNNRLLEDSELLGEEVVTGFRMHSLGNFPAVNKTETDSTIQIEVYKVTEPRVLNHIYTLEGYTGKRDHSQNWYDTTDVNTKFGTAELFYFKKSLEGSRSIVEDGIWK